jgi:hypothetical protein
MVVITIGVTDTENLTRFEVCYCSARNQGFEISGTFEV